MTNIILSGCNGKMGKVITECVNGNNDCQIVAGVDINTEASDVTTYNLSNTGKRKGRCYY